METGMRAPLGLGAPIRILSVVNEFVDWVARRVAATLVGLMTAIVLASVFFRYVLNNSITWTEDVSLIMMITAAFLIAPVAYRQGLNVAIEMLVSALPLALLRALRIALNLLVLWILYRHFFEALALVERGWGIRVNTVPIAWAWCYMPVPFAFGAMALAGIELILRDVVGILSRRDDWDLPHQRVAEPL